MSQIIIIIVTLSILLIAGILHLHSYIRESEIEKVFEGISILKKYSELYLAESPNLDFNGINGCYFEGAKGDLLKAMPKQTLYASEWIGLDANIEDCSISVDGSIYNDQTLRFVVDTTTDNKVMILKGIWKDVISLDANGDIVLNKSDGIADIEQLDETGIKDKQFIEVKLQNE